MQGKAESSLLIFLTIKWKPEFLPGNQVTLTSCDNMMNEIRKVSYPSEPAVP